jgi:syndecan 4
VQVQVNCADGNQDGDLLCNAADNCPYFATANAADADDDGRGNACECTDQNGDGQNTVSDLIAINLAIFNPAQVTPLCDGTGDGICDVNDLIAANVEIFSPTNTSICPNQPVPGP